MKLKLCKMCDEIKEISCFSIRKDSKDGFRNECKECRKKFHKLWYSNNVEKLKNYRKTYYKDNITYFKDSNKRYYTNNKDKITRKLKEEYMYNPKKYKERTKDWRNLNKSKRIEYNIKRRDLKIMLDNKNLVKNYSYIFTLFGFKCFKCSSEKNLVIDHHIPLSLGYGLDYGNCVILCSSCNCKKNANLPEKYYSKEELYNLNIILEKQRIRGVENY